MKICIKCKKEKPLTNFSQRKSGISKGCYASYCRGCYKIYHKEYKLKYPWAKHFMGISGRCSDKKSSYHKRGIKNFLKTHDLKYLWFRDKAYLLDRPSIDRIAIYGNYTLKNCRFIELKENQKRPKAWVKVCRGEKK